MFVLKTPPKPKQQTYLECRSIAIRSNERVNQLNRAIILRRCQTLGIENSSAGLFGCLQDEGVPERRLMSFLDLESLENSIGSINHDLPAHIVTHQLAKFLERDRASNFAAQVDAEFL